MIWAKVVSWWASKHMSNILLGLLITYFAYNYHQGQLCRERESMLEDMREIQAQLIESETRQANEAIDASDHPCLGLNVDDVLQDRAVLPGAGTGRPDDS